MLAYILILQHLCELYIASLVRALYVSALEPLFAADRCSPSIGGLLVLHNTSFRRYG